METWLTTLITIVCSVIASSGFWAYLQRRSEKKDARTKMILGLGHDRLVFLCLTYIKRGSLTKEEHENLYTYLYVPYKDLKGNGTVDLLIEQVKKLPISGSIHM